MSRTLRGSWNRWWFTPVEASNLGICRILFYGCVLVFYLGRDFTGWGSVPAAFSYPATVLGQLGVRAASPELLGVIAWTWKCSLLAACLGLATRGATVLAFLLGWYLLDIPHNMGKVNHNDGVLVLSMLVLSLSRCGAAFSLDAWFRRRRGVPDPGPSSEFRWPVRAVWVILAMIYFAAGLAKFRWGGIAWFHPDNLAITMLYHNYGQMSFAPWTDWGLTLAQYPLACVGLALFSALAELLFPLALVFTRARWIFVGAALAMQLGIRAFLGPHFEQYLFAYLFFVPWDHLWHRFRGMESVRAPKSALP